MSEELIIDESNFEEYFFDVRKQGPKKGQVMAVYTAIAQLVEGNLKRDLIYLLSCTSKVKESIILLRKIGLANEEDAIRVCREITQDLKNGLPAVEIEAKPYEYKLQAFYYANHEHVPKDDIHWSFVELKNLDQHLEKIEQSSKGIIKSKIIEQNEEVG